MQRLITRNFDYTHRVFMVVLAATAILVVSLVAAVTVLAVGFEKPTGKHFLTVYDRGEEKGLVTNAPTVKKALDEAGIVIGQNDLVEPGLDEELVAASYNVNIYRARLAIIKDGNQTLKILTPHQTGKQIVQHAGLELQEEDITTVAPIDDIVAYGAGLQVTIDRATPFSLVLYGKKTTAYSQAGTVEEMLKQKHIGLGENDTLSVKPSDPLVAGMKVEIWRDGKQTVTVEEDVAFPVEQIQDADREVGYRQVKTPGVKGKATVTYEIVMKNGKELKRKKIQSLTTKQPSKQVEIVGAKPSFGGDFAAALARLRACESGGNYSVNTGNGFYGAYQYDIGTWGGYGGYANASLAPPAVQDAKVRETYLRRGWQPWPSCGSSLPDSYR